MFRSEGQEALTNKIQCLNLQVSIINRVDNYNKDCSSSEAQGSIFFFQEPVFDLIVEIQMMENALIFVGVRNQRILIANELIRKYPLNFLFQIPMVNWKRSGGSPKINLFIIIIIMTSQSTIVNTQKNVPRSTRIVYVIQSAPRKFVLHSDGQAAIL